MNKGWRPFLLTLLMAGLTSDLAGQTNGAEALTSKESTEIPVSFVRGTFGLWSGGAFVFVEHRFSGAPVFKIFGRDGKQVSQMALSIPEASHINMYDNSIARGPDGSLAVIGSAYTNNSRGTTFLAWVSPDAQKQTIVRLSPFSPTAVTVAADDTIWVAGHLRPTGPEKDGNQQLLRRYDRTGKLLGSFLPWSNVGRLAPRTPPPDMRSVLLSSPTAVGWYSPEARTYVEFSLDGKEVYRIQTPEHPRGETLGAALCDDGRIFVSASVNRNQTRAASWGIHALDRVRGEWSFLPQPGSWGIVYGCDRARLASTLNNRTFTWLEPAAK